MLRILVMVSLNEDEKMRLESYLFAHYMYAETSSKEQLVNADIIIGNPGKEQLKQCRRLKWVQLMSAGSDAYYDDPMFETVYLTNASGTYGLSVSEHMIGALLFQFRRFKSCQAHQQQRIWENSGEVRSIDGCNVLILGLGDIGSSFAKRMHTMGAYTIGIRRHHQEKRPAYIEEQYGIEALADVLPRCDVVALCLPKHESTHHIINADMLERMKTDAVLINVGRGSAVDTEALIKALKQKTIGGACLDVFEQEPLPQTHPLWDLDNVFLTSHCAGIWNARATRNRFLCLVKENLERFMKGKPLLNMVDRQSGYRQFDEDLMFR